MKKRKVKISYEEDLKRQYTEDELKDKTQKEIAGICVSKFGYSVGVSYESCDRATLIKAIINNDDNVFYEGLPAKAFA